jgi:ATP synthase protein I
MREAEKSPEKTRAGQAPKPALNFLLMGAGSIFTSMIAAGFIVGYALDQLFDTTPILLLACGALGFFGGMQKVMKLSSKLDPVIEDRKQDEKS